MMEQDNTLKSIGSSDFASMSQEKLAAMVKEMVKQEVKQQNEATQMLTDDMANDKHKKGRYVTCELLMENTVPPRYLPTNKKKEIIPTGHRQDFVDVIDRSSNTRFYNVSVSDSPENSIPYGPGQQFVIYFKNQDDIAGDHGLGGVSDLLAYPIKRNRIQYAFNEFLSTYTPGSKKGFERLQSLPFCREVPTLDDVMKKRTPVTGQMRVFSTTKSPLEMREEFDGRLRDKLGLSDDEPLPTPEEQDLLFQQNPELLDEIYKDMNSNTDRPSILIGNDGIVIGDPTGAGRMRLTNVGTEFKGRVDMAQKPQQPMDPIGVGSTELPLDLLPQGNVLIPHPKKLPALDELLTAGVMIYRLVSGVTKLTDALITLAGLEEPKELETDV